MAREWSTNELYRFQLTGERPKDDEVQADVKTKTKAETKPKHVDVQPTDKA
jgi:hypothetical protein